MSTVYLTIGLPGSGKSFWSRQKAHEDERTVIINRDAFRTMIKDNYTFDLMYEPFIKASSNRSIEEALKYGLDIIVDETHIKKERRKEIIQVIKNYEETDFIEELYGKTKIVYVWFTETEKNIENRMKESRGYDREKWEEVINKMKESFEEPTEDEKYNELIKINPFRG
ncbi:MAG: AAA family ATPase [bacterium]